MAVKLQSREMIRVVPIREPADLGPPTQGGESDLAVVQCATTTEHEVSGVRIGVRQV